jgi:peptide/nickel transport system permease protein
MGNYFIRRTAQMLFVIWGVVTTTFFIIRIVPGDPARLMEPPGTPESAIQVIREKIGTNKPIPEQYVEFLGKLMKGDLGKPFRGGTSVTAIIVARLSNTFKLGLVSMLVATTLGSLLGVAAALWQNSIVDRAVLVFVSLALATPNFWLAVMLVLFFAIRLRWLPAIDMAGPKSYILPVTTLAVVLLPLIVRTVRQGFVDALGEDFVRAARARGLSERRVVFLHVMKVAAIPLITLVGIQAGYVLGGSLVVESIFNWPGIGMYTLSAIQARDYPMVQGCVLVIAVVFVIVNFVVDMAYAFLDPRIKY